MTPKWPGKTLVIKSIRPSHATEVTLLETGQILPWQRKGDHLEITLPAFDLDVIKSRVAHAFRISHVARPQVASVPKTVKEIEQ